jgi:putative FmdB family regulatory protein
MGILSEVISLSSRFSESYNLRESVAIIKKAQDRSMPIYEYSCRGCGREFEWLTRADETPQCPACGKTDLARNFSVPAAHSAAKASSCPAADSCGMKHCCGPNCGLHH